MRLAVVRGGCVSSDCLLGRYSRVGGFHLVGVGLAQWQEGQVGLGVLISPRGHLLPESLHGLEKRTISMPKMARQAALVIAEPGRATPLAQHFYDEARSYLAS